MSSTGVRLKQNLGKQARWIANAALDLLFPPRCVVCHRIGVRLCETCIAAFEPIVGPICASCGEPVPFATLCPRCKAEKRAFESVRSAFLYTETIRKAVHAFKYERRRDVAKPLADAMSGALASPPNQAILCPVPLYADREAARGYNQSELLSHHLSQNWAVSVLPKEAFRRVRDTTSQVGLDYGDRQRNVNAAFLADRAFITGQTILLVDDVCTTGATLHACAQSLIEAGAVSVSAVTLARAV
jgi:competence protein ComFC